MIIGVNARLLLPRKLEGIGWFAHESLKRITRQHPEHEFHFYFDRPFDPSFVFNSNVKPFVLFPQARHPYLWYLFFEWSIPFALKKSKADLFFSPDGWLSLSSSKPAVGVIHDLNFEHHADFFTDRGILNYYRKNFPKFAHKATRLATVSEYSKQDIIDTYHIDPEKIDVVYNGCNAEFKPLTTSEKTEVLNRYTQNCPYFLFVGSIHKRKNLAHLFKAFDQFKTQTDSKIKLLIVGSKKWWKGEIEDTFQAMTFKDEVVFSGHLDSAELAKVTGAALALTYISFFEGFGIPILEAFHAEIPVITSNTTSMPEVAADAALFVDPYSVDSIAEAMRAIYRDNNLRERLIEKGRVRKDNFSWDKTATLLWRTLEKTIIW